RNRLKSYYVKDMPVDQ
ncbi:hypothetical protein KIPB_011071, partial [Kipferlia bialata]